MHWTSTIHLYWHERHIEYCRLVEWQAEHMEGDSSGRGSGEKHHQEAFSRFSRCWPIRTWPLSVSSASPRRREEAILAGIMEELTKNKLLYASSLEVLYENQLGRGDL